MKTKKLELKEQKNKKCVVVFNNRTLGKIAGGIILNENFSVDDPEDRWQLKCSVVGLY